MPDLEGEESNRALAEFRRLETKLCAPYVKLPRSEHGIPRVEKAQKTGFDFGCGYQYIGEMLVNEEKRILNESPSLHGTLLFE